MIVHIHLPDDNAEFTLATIIDLINAGYKMSVPEPDPSVDDLSALLSLAIARAASPEALLDDEVDEFLVDRQYEGSHAVRVDLASKAQARRQRYDDAARASSVRCPSCKAPQGRPCVSPGSGKSYGDTYAHVDRVQAAYAFLAHKPKMLVDADRRAKQAWVAAKAITLDEM